MSDPNEEHRPSIQRLSRDLVKASATLSEQEARFLVDAYYISQEDRKRAHNQERSMADEPNLLIGWLAEQSRTLENQIKRALEPYAESKPQGRWMLSIYGIGPVLTAGLLAHIDISQAPTVGHIWRFAGLDPTSKWDRGQKRPWNASLKTLCWKIGQSFMKFSGEEECVYGQVYLERKAYEIARNEAGSNAEIAKRTLVERNFKKDTEAYKAYSIGKLPKAQIDARARRYATKLFLSHVHLVWRWTEHRHISPKPYAIGHMDHTHFIEPPNLDLVEGLTEALQNQFRPQ
jgi:hypothetical protein